jgi:hypothetical protein
MKRGGYYRSGRLEIVAHGASMESDFRSGPAQARKTGVEGEEGKEDPRLPRRSERRGQHLKKGEKLSKEWGKLPP